MSDVQSVPKASLGWRILVTAGMWVTYFFGVQPFTAAQDVTLAQNVTKQLEDSNAAYVQFHAVSSAAQNASTTALIAFGVITLVIWGSYAYSRLQNIG